MHALEIRGLTKTYKNGVRALRGIDLIVEEGEFFALLGPNGAGKSTTIGIIASLINKTSGRISIFGVDVDRDYELAKSYIGLVPQELNFSQFENVEGIVINQAGYYGIRRHIARLRAETYLRQLSLWEKRHERSRDLSGGMKRRLMIARALVHEPRLLILDEPTAGVDIELRRSMWDFLLDLNKSGTTIILTTHYLEEAERLCRHIAIIDEGAIVENTGMKDLLATLHTETFVLDLAAPIRTVPESDLFEFRVIDATTVEVVIDKNQAMNDVFQLLSDFGIRVSSMRNKSNRLEELFLSLVGENGI
jgi:ABC-2 type transport system ATP-binding protein